ncbi:MAG TPA: PDZ domain-containing protein [Methylovorus sp.]|jgi:hypothetical protein|nr:PDZ domain-containing protein [Methylovorus sp.]
MHYITSLLLAVALVGCASQKPQPVPVDNNRASNGNPYAETYVSHPQPATLLAPDPDGPKLYLGDKKEDDYKRMLEQGYDMLGYSSFESGDVAPELATQQARQVKADLVLVYTQLTGSTPASVKLQQLRQQAAAQKAATQKPAVDEPKVSGNANAPVDEAKQRYHYFASYWVKLAPPLIGVHVNGPVAEGEPGLPVVAVVKQSPADKAGLVDGDVLTRLGEVNLDKPEALTRAAKQYAGKTVEVDFRRSGSAGKTMITLNQRSQ